MSQDDAPHPPAGPGSDPAAMEAAHEDFPLDWTVPPPTSRESCAVFIASRQRLDNPLLLDHLPDRQTAN